jgi:hypothetical protein
MPNDFASPQGMYARAGIDVTPTQAVVERADAEHSNSPLDTSDDHAPNPRPTRH